MWGLRIVLGMLRVRVRVTLTLTNPNLGSALGSKVRGITV